MKKTLNLWQIAGFTATVLGGVLLHFLFEWTGDNPVVGLFSAVNESTWEHMKLLFFPMLIFALIERRFFPEISCFWQIKLVGAAVGLILIPVLFYTLNGVFGQTPAAVNIALFVFAAAFAFFWETRLFRKKSVCFSPRLSLALLCLILLCFFVFTFATPRLPLFLDPLTETYGI